MVYNKLFVFLSLILLFSCENGNICLSDYSINKYYRNGFTVDSIDINNNSCFYYTTIYTCRDDDNCMFKGKFFVKDSVYYYKIIENPGSEYFPLFDLTKKKDYSVKINLLDTTKIQIQNVINVNFKQIIKTKENKEVFVYRVSGLYCSMGGKYDGVFFINYEQGIIGSYLYDIDENGTQYIANPEGNIFDDVIDYSKFVKVKIL